MTSALLPIYNGQYVLQTTDFGFLWLDTVALKGGLVEAESSCAPGMPPSNSGIYVVGDCNGTGTISSSGNYVLVRQFNSQCGAAEKGYCGGPSIRGPARLTFGLGGSWPYLGDLGNLADSTQTTDLQGRTWWVESLDLWHFVWHASGAPNAAPTAGATAINLSAAGRTDKSNYYGDRWQLQDTSISGSPITSIAWDFLYKGSFAPDEAGGPTVEGAVAGYFPCDPSAASPGTFRTGANCLQSLGLTNPPAAGSYVFAEQSANANGTSVNPFVSSAIAVVCPQATITGYTGFAGTCAKTGGTLGVLVGGNADASGSSGNVGEAVFDWSFTGSTPISVQGPTVPVPTGATGFALAITYPGGYRATAQGAVAQANLIAAFSLAPNPALVASALTLTNQMQAASATLNSVDFLIQPGTCGAPPVMGSNPLASSFLAGGGTAAVTGPATSGGYCMYLRYNFTPSGGAPQSLTVSDGFSMVNWTAAPGISISPVPFCSSSCQMQAGTTYDLWDSETITISPHPGAAWDLSGTPIGASADANVPISWTPASGCSSCTLRIVVNGVAATLPVSVSGPAPTPAPTPAPSSGPIVIASGDFDGDGLADKSVFRSATGTWYVNRSDGGGELSVQFGASGDVPVAGNYAGDARSDFAVFRPCDGTWYVLSAEGVSQPAVQWGTSGDIPVPGQYGGDSRIDLAVWRPSNGTWYVRTAEGVVLPSVQWGAASDIPVPGDYDGDGVTDMAVFRPSNGTWYVRFSGGGTAAIPWGASGDIPVAADFTGSRRADYGIFRPSTGTWYVKASSTLTDLPSVAWGALGDVPLPAQMAGDSRADEVVWRPSNGTWYVRSAEDTLPPGVAWGAMGDTPLTR